jgi:RimJ/RimL family protein N-acetyltransferase
VYLTHLVLHDRSSGTRNSVFLALEDHRVAGAAFFGRQIVLACEPQALKPLAGVANRRRGERMIVGPRGIVRAFWELLRERRPRPRFVRERQPVLAVDRDTLMTDANVAVNVRLAGTGDVASVVESSAQTIEHELGYDPRRTSPDFASGVRAMVERNYWWVAERNGQLCFFCHVGPWSDQTAQLQGIWTPPPLRGKGLATAALAAVCEALLGEFPTLSLYVNDFNERAVALYRRVGFEQVSEFQTILF